MNAPGPLRIPRRLTGALLLAALLLGGRGVLALHPYEHDPATADIECALCDLAAAAHDSAPCAAPCADAVVADDGILAAAHAAPGGEAPAAARARGPPAR